MCTELKNYLKSIVTVEQKELEQIISYFKPIKTVKNEVLCDFGQVCNHFYFIINGCLRLYEIDNKGNDITGYFALENSFISANTSFILQKPSRDCLVSLEDSELLVISRNDFYKLVNSVPPFASVYHKFMEVAFIHSQMRIYSFLGMEGIDKIKWVMEHEPKLLTRVSSKAVASYLGMTNSTLSKLRAKL